MKNGKQFKRAEILFLLITTLLIPIPFIIYHVYYPKYKFQIITANESELYLVFDKLEFSTSLNDFDHILMFRVEKLPDNISTIFVYYLYLKVDSKEYVGFDGSAGNTPQGYSRGHTFNLDKGLNWKTVKIRAEYGENTTETIIRYDTGWLTVGDPFLADNIFDQMKGIFGLIILIGYTIVIYIIQKDRIMNQKQRNYA